MPDPFIGEIRMFAGNFAPSGWEFCEGQLLPVSQNSALFSLIGTTYGGDGKTTFALPDLRGRVPVGVGKRNPELLANYQLGQTGGAETVTLSTVEIPSHTHTLSGLDTLKGNVRASASTRNTPNPQNSAFPTYPAGGANFYTSSPPSVDMANGSVKISVDPSHPPSIGSTGGTQPHINMQPFQCINYIISLQGVYPSED